VAAEERRRTIVPLDEDAISVLIVKVEGAMEVVQPTTAGPHRGVVPKGGGHLIIPHVVIESKDTVAAVELLVPCLISGTADRSHWFTLFPSDEQLCRPMLEPWSLLGIQAFVPFFQYGWNPQRITTEDALGKS
jgi:hypothetical protein